MKKFCTTSEAFRLLMEGQQALTAISGNGARIDKAYLEHAINDVGLKIEDQEKQLRNHPSYQIWRRRYGDKSNLHSPEQLSRVAFGPLGFPPPERDEEDEDKDRESATEAAFEGIDDPFIRGCLNLRRLVKGRSTFLMGIQREMVQHDDGLWYVHPSYHLNTVRSFRSSCTGPAYQTNPVRNPMLSDMIRKCYIPRPGQEIDEFDYAQQEIRIGACYHEDLNMISYVNDPTTDMHRDATMKIFFLKKEEVNKAARHLGKNKFVFPQTYGSVYYQCAKDLWEAVETQGIRVGKDNDGPSLFDRLRENGITERGRCRMSEEPVKGTFEYHVKKIQDWMWTKQFPTYARWKETWIEKYHRDGGVMFKTGFCMFGPHKRNDITNYCIQCDSFQCLLFSLPRILERLRRYRMKTKVIGQIHDCVVTDSNPRERRQLAEIVREVMVKEVMAHWKWIIVPLEVECEMCPRDRSWFDKIALKEEKGDWVPSDLVKFEKNYGPWSAQCVV